MQTPARLLAEMDETNVNRRADGVIYIHADESQLHRQVGAFQEYPTNKIVTHFGLWEIALKIAISRLTIDNATIEGIDRAAVEKEIDAIKKKFAAKFPDHQNCREKHLERIEQNCRPGGADAG
jgi:hypothetical protein